MERLGQNLDAADRTYRSAVKKLATGKGNLVRQVEQFRELGANVKKRLPRSVVDDAGVEQDDDPNGAGAADGGAR